MAETSCGLVSVRMNLNALLCPVCQLELQPPIYHCSTGHAICSRCLLKRRKKCPTCDRPVGTTPSIALQTIIQSIQVPCPYSFFGCNRDSIPLKEKTSHEQECSFGPCHCPIESCNFKCFALLLSTHIKKSHPGSSGKSFAYNKMFTVYLKQEDDFSLLYGSDDQVFLLLKERCRTFATSFKLSVVCLLPESHKNSYGYELSVCANGNKVLIESCAVKLREWRRDLPKGACLFIPPQIISSFISSIDVRVCIKNGCEK